MLYQIVAVLRQLIPFAYTIIVALGFGAIFRKKFSESVAPAFMIQMLLMIICGMAFSRISYGIIFEVAIAIIFIAIKWHTIKDYVITKDYGIPVFVVFYLLLMILNEGKYFGGFDEFSHWGMFLKETLRLDNLYCVSDVNMSHKDYVPAIIMFEALWCKLTLRYREADAYRSLQMLGFSIVLPVISGVCYQKEDSEAKFDKKKLINTFSKFIILMIVPIFYVGNSFYHTIYQDAIFGFLIYYCVYTVFSKGWSLEFRTFMLSISSSIMIMAKMTGMAILPMIWLLFVIAYRREIRERKIFGIVHMALPLAVPAVLWVVINKFITYYVPKSGNIQSYDGLSLSKVLSIITHDGTVTYQSQVESSYINTIFKESLFAGLPYAAIVIASILIIFFLSRKDIIYGVWTVATGTLYAFVFWLLYLMSFSEYEAKVLASHERYLNSMLMAIVFVLFMILFQIEVSKRYISYILTVTVYAALASSSNYIQLFPSSITGETGGSREDTYAIPAEAINAEATKMNQCSS